MWTLDPETLQNLQNNKIYCSHQLCVPRMHIKQNKMQEEKASSDKAEKPETVAWTPPMSVYSWPQINLPDKYNPLYHLALLYRPMNVQGSQGLATVYSQWKASVSFSFLSCMAMEENSPSVLLSVHLLVLRISRPVRSHTPNTRGFCLTLSLSFLSVSV